MLFCGVTAFSQAVKDRNVIPVAVNLNQVLRMTITNGGNIEFVFNTIEDYKNGLSSEIGGANPIPLTNNFYKTDFTVSSSTRWKLEYGTEEATFLGTDKPANTFALNNVGFKITNNGTNIFETGATIGLTPAAQLWSVPTTGATKITALQTYPTTLITDNTVATNSNAGDAADNSFTLNWRCGTAEYLPAVAGPAPMNAVKLIDQSPSPAADRYVANVLFELSAILI